MEIKFRLTMLLLFATIACTVETSAQVNTLGSLSDRHVNALKVYGDTLFAACDEGLYSLDMKLRDGWKAYAFVGVKIIDFVKSGSRVLAIGWEEREYEDPDMIWYLDPFGTMLLEADGMGGSSRDVTPGWVADCGEGCFFSLAQDAFTPDRIYMSCTPTKAGEYPNEFYAVFSSEDFGSQWTVATLTLADGARMEQQVLAGPPSLHVNKTNGRVYVYGAPAVDCLCHYLYVSDDHLGSLQMIIDMYWFGDEFSAEYERPSMHTQVVPSPHDGEEYLLKTKGYGVWKSTGGKSWNLVTERFLVDGVFYDEETPGIAYYVKHLQRDDKTWMQLYRSSDGGETWALWQEEEGINPISILMHQGSLYFQNALTGEVCQWPLKENVQRETALVKEGKVWKYKSVNEMAESSYEYEFYIKGDTLIGDETYKKLYTIDETMYKTTEPVYCGALREIRTLESITVVFIRSGHENVELLYNFNPLVGDNYYFGELYGTVIELDDVTINGVKRNRVRLVEHGEDIEFDDIDGFWIEGIGSSAGLLTPVSFLSWGYSDYLIGCYEEDKCICTGKDFYQVNDPTGIAVKDLNADHPSSAPSHSSSIYDLQGRLVEATRNLPVGVYIKNRKKVVVR